MRATREKFDLRKYAQLHLNYQQAGYALPKWVQFCAYFAIDLGFEVTYYDSVSTVSKYVYVREKEKTFKVRFSNHKPNKQREKERDCDFFVGLNNYGWSRTEDAIRATEEFFKKRER